MKLFLGEKKASLTLSETALQKNNNNNKNNNKYNKNSLRSLFAGRGDSSISSGFLRSITTSSTVETCQLNHGAGIITTAATAAASSLLLGGSSRHSRSSSSSSTCQQRQRCRVHFGTNTTTTTLIPSTAKWHRVFDEATSHAVWYHMEDIQRFKHQARMQAHFIVRKERVQQLAMSNSNNNNNSKSKKNKNNNRTALLQLSSNNSSSSHHNGNQSRISHSKLDGLPTSTLSSSSPRSSPSSLQWSETLRSALLQFSDDDVTLEEIKMTMDHVAAATGAFSDADWPGLERWASWWSSTRAPAKRMMQTEFKQMQREMPLDTITESSTSRYATAKQLRQVSRKHSKAARLFAIYMGRLVHEQEQH